MNVKGGRTSARYVASQVAKRAVFERHSTQDILALVRSRVTLIGDCWIWLGAGADYGVVSLDGHTWRVNRLVIEATKGPMAPGLLACHTCDIMQCVNPDHLYAGTSLQNLRDRRDRWRGSAAYADRLQQARRVYQTLALTKGVQ